MQSINDYDLDDPIRSGGGSYTIALGVRYPDPDDPAYEHALIWKFEPTLATDAQTPLLDIRGFLHKKYWTDIRDDIEYTKYSTDDGSNLIESHGWFETITPESVPTTLRDYFETLFGPELRTNTFNVDNHADDLTEPDAVAPDTAEPFTATIDIKVDASTTEEISEADPRTADGSFTSHVKNADGEITYTAYRVQHSFAWWIRPVSTDDGARLTIEQCYHKTWDDGMVGSFDCEYENEGIITAYRDQSITPPLDTMPKDVLETLAGWFGEPLLKRSLDDAGGAMPKYVYECIDCDEAFEVTPRDHCPRCDNDSLIRYENPEQYAECKENETEDERDLKEFLVNAEPTVTTEEP